MQFINNITREGTGRASINLQTGGAKTDNIPRTVVTRIRTLAQFRPRYSFP